MITFEEFKEVFGEKIIGAENTDEFFEAHYKSTCLSRIRAYLNTFEGSLWKNQPSTEELYNWCITLETIFGIKTERNGK